MKQLINCLIGLDLKLRWKNLRALGNSRLLRSSYFWFIFVLIAAHFLNQLKSPLVFSLFGSTQQVALELPFSWIAFYFAATAFAVASLVQCNIDMRHTMCHSQ
jgi:hypothetical protein